MSLAPIPPSLDSHRGEGPQQRDKGERASRPPRESRPFTCHALPRTGPTWRKRSLSQVAAGLRPAALWGSTRCSLIGSQPARQLSGVCFLFRDQIVERWQQGRSLVEVEEERAGVRRRRGVLLWTWPSPRARPASVRSCPTKLDPDNGSHSYENRKGRRDRLGCQR